MSALSIGFATEKNRRKFGINFYSAALKITVLKMKILPYKKITIKHNKPKSDICDFINSSIAPRKLFGCPDSSKVFYGECNDNDFKLMRIINYRNDFLPVLIGKIYDEEIVITMRPHLFIFIFVIFWMSVAVLSFFVSSIVIIFRLFYGIFEPATLIGVILAPGGLILLKFAFWRETKKSEAELRRVIED